jgi:NADH:ubiquinone oxidoreductase subunit 6 (subunit J)
MLAWEKTGGTWSDRTLIYIIILPLYALLILAALLVAFVCMFIPGKRLWSEYISAGLTGSIVGFLLTHTLMFLALRLVFQRLHSGRTVPGPAGTGVAAAGGIFFLFVLPIFVSGLGILLGSISGIALVRRAKRRNTTVALPERTA